MPTGRARSARHRHGSPAASSSGTNRRRLLARAIHSNTMATSPFPPSSAMSDDTWEVPVFSASSDALWLLADTGFGGRKVGRSASCYEPAVARRRGPMRRPSSCASEADYFNIAVERYSSRSAVLAAKRTPMHRTSSLNSLLDDCDDNTADMADALVPELLGDYRCQLAHLSTLPALAGDPTEIHGDAARFYPLASRTAEAEQSADVAVVAQVPQPPPPPRPQFLRQLGQRPGSSGGVSPLPIVTSGEQAAFQEKCPTTLHYAAFVDAAHMPEHRDDNGGSSAGRLARFTRQLMTGLSFGARSAVDSSRRSESPCQQQHQLVPYSSPSPDFGVATTLVATFDSTSQELRSSRLNVSRPAHGGGWSGDSAGATLAAEGRLNMRFAKNRPGATRRNTCLTIPTARAPLFLPNLLLVPVTSPASASLQTEVATASASTMASPFLHPASAECSSSMFYDAAALLESQSQLHTAPIVAASAHDMLCRLAGARAGGGCQSASAAGGGHQVSPPVSLHTDAQEEWGLFISDCFKQLDHQAVPTMDSSATCFDRYSSECSASMLSSPDSLATTVVVPSAADHQALPKYWFSELGGADYEKLHGLVARGIPEGFRRQVWMECSGALDISRPSSGMLSGYAKIEEIDLDLLRTDTTTDHGVAPCTPNTDEDATNSDVACLRYILYSYAHANPDVGYCQGMNKIAFGLLRAGLDASDSLSLLQCLLDGGILPAGMFKSPMAVVQTDQLVLEELVERRLPRLSAHLRVKLGGAAPLAPATVSWFLTLFVDCLPEPHRLRVWDMLFVRGYPAVFQACLAILELNQPALLLCATPVAVYALLQNVRAVMEHVDVDDFGALAFGKPRSFSVSASEIGLLRQQVSL
ncbi:hypothetical protein IWW39_000447 [Coemansia spiralis]|uniref:Rab-GAP TBC domain-containing protein n=1 Tax=Coemansia spiralis TaxID=417178 RepID=A0A9W8GNJ7_9FUNG|nr:hypothetical protein IWW39_000447 [Coemansia spiralis]